MRYLGPRALSPLSLFSPLGLSALFAALLFATVSRADFSLLSLKNSLVQFALSQISVEGEFEITAQNVIEPEDGSTELTGIEIADAEGVWLRAEAFAIQWNASRILSGELEINTLTIRGLEVLRSPNPPELSVKPGSELAQAEPRGLFDWPRAPLALRIDAMRLERAFIAAGVLAEQSLAFEATGAAQDEGAVQAVQLTLRRTDRITGDINLDYARNFDSNVLRLDVSAAEAAGGLVAELIGLPAESASNVTITADGPLTDWRLTLDAEAEAVLIAAVSAAIHADARVSVTATASVQPGPKLDEDLRTALGDRARLELSVEEDAAGVIVIRQARLASPAIDAELEGRFERASNTINARLRAEAGPALARALGEVSFSRIGFDGELNGVVSALTATGALAISDLATAPVDLAAGDLTMTARQDGDAYLLDLGGSAKGLRLDQLSPDRLGDATMETRLRLDGSAITIDTVSLASRALTAQLRGSADFEANTLDLTYTASAPDLAPLASAYEAEIAGAAQIDGSVTGPIAAPRLVGKASIKALAASGQRLGDPELTHDLTLATPLRGALTLVTDMPDYGPVDAAVAFHGDATDLTFSAITASALGLRVSGDELILRDGLFTGDLALLAPTLKTLSPVLGEPVDGRAEGLIRLKSEDRSQAADARLMISGLSLSGADIDKATVTVSTRDALNDGDFDFTAILAPVRASTARIDTVRLEGRFSPGREELGARLNATNIAADGVSLDTLALNARGPLGKLALDLSTSGRMADGKPISLTATAALDAMAPALSAVINSALARIGESEVALRRPMMIAERADGLSIAPIALRAPGAEFSGEALLARDGLIASGALDSPNLDELAALLDLPIERGSLAATFSLDSRPSSARARLDATAENLAASEVVNAEAALSATLDGVWDGRQARLSARVSGPFGAPMETTFAIDLAPGGIVPSPQPDAAISGAARWKGRLEELWGYLPFPDHDLSGALDADLAVGGTLANPVPSGSVSLSDGAYQYLETGTVLTGLSVATTRAADGAMTLQAQATDGSGAPVTVTGRIIGSRLDATLTARDAVLIRRDDATAALSMDISAKGPLTAPAVVGEIRIDRAELRLLDASPPSVVDLGEVEIAGAEPDRSAQPREDAAAERGPTLDIGVTAPSSIFVRGRGLTSEWRADLRIAGRAATPRITGRIEKLRGELDFVGRRFELARGQVDFLGAKSPDPVLDIALERQTDDLLGRIAISGTAGAPELSFQSEPALPEDEVLPRLIFDKSRQSLSASQALELASGLATLLSGGEGVLGRVRSATGLDVLSIDREGDSASVRAGRRVADGVFVGVRQPVDGAGSTVEVEAEVFDGITIDSAVKPQGGSSFGLNFRYDF